MRTAGFGPAHSAFSGQRLLPVGLRPQIVYNLADLSLCQLPCRLPDPALVGLTKVLPPGANSTGFVRYRVGLFHKMVPGVGVEPTTSGS